MVALKNAFLFRLVDRYEARPCINGTGNGDGAVDVGRKCGRKVGRFIQRRRVGGHFGSDDVGINLGEQTPFRACCKRSGNQEETNNTSARTKARVSVFEDVGGSLLKTLWPF